MPFINNDGINIYYEIEGNGPPLILQHGLGDSIESFREFGYVERLRSNFRLFLIDARGHGKSDKPHRRDAYDAKNMVGDILAVADSHRVRQFHYFGFSMGCRLGFELAKYAPGRMVAATMGGHHPFAFSLEFFRQLFREGLSAWIDLVESAAGPLSPSTRDRLRDNDANALRALVETDRSDISEVLASMTGGCRLFAGTDDERYGDVKRAAFEIPGANFVALQGLNHFQSVLRGDLVAPLICEYILAMLPEKNP